MVLDTCYKVGKSVPQGSVLSPFLFNVFQNSLYVDLCYYGGNWKKDFYSFADDLSFTFVNISDLNWKLDKVESWARRAAMEINKKKSGILFKFISGHRWAMENFKGSY